MGVNQFNDGGQFICVDFKKIPLVNDEDITDKDIVNSLDRALSLKKYVLAKNCIIKVGNYDKELNFIFSYYGYNDGDGYFVGCIHFSSESKVICLLHKNKSGTSYLAKIW